MVGASGRSSLSRAELELCWYWNQSEADMGVSSSFERMVRCLKEGRPLDEGAHTDEISDFKLEAARRARTIRGRLERCGTRTHSVLFAVLGPRGESARVPFGELTPIAKLFAARLWRTNGSPGATWVAWLEQLSTEARKGRRPAKAQLEAIRLHAERLYADALKNYGGRR